MSEMKEKIGKRFIYIIVNETTDVRDLYINTFLMGSLNKDYNVQPYLFTSKQLKKLKLLWPDLGVEQHV